MKPGAPRTYAKPEPRPLPPAGELSVPFAATPPGPPRRPRRTRDCACRRGAYRLCLAGSGARSVNLAPHGRKSPPSIARGQRHQNVRLRHVRAEQLCQPPRADSSLPVGIVANQRERKTDLALVNREGMLTREPSVAAPIDWGYLFGGLKGVRHVGDKMRTVSENALGTGALICIGVSPSGHFSADYIVPAEKP